MTNVVTNIVWMISSNAVPVMWGPDWSTQQSIFLMGFSSGFPLALGLAVFYAIVRSVRSSPFPSHDD